MTSPVHHAQDVTAVVVTCGDTPYLSRTLSALAAQQRLPARLLVIDVAAPGRDVGSGRPLLDVISETIDEVRLPTRIVGVPAARNFGDAVRLGLAEHAELVAKAERRHEARTGEIPVVTPDAVAWLWLLHDDSAPDPAALAELLREVELATSLGLAGCKQRDWARPDRLISAGIHATRATRRYLETDVDEIDQGQLDHRSDVLAVSTAGALIRRDIWAALDGTDPHLGPFNDGLELSRRVRLAGYRVAVVPDAIVYHAQASYHDLRGDNEGAAPDVRRSFGARRAAQLHTWISGVAPWQVPLVYLAIALLTPLRALWRAARKDFDLLGAELKAGWHVLSHPKHWRLTRTRTEAVRTVPRATLDRIYTPRSAIGARKRELRRSARDARAAAEAPSELELAELSRLAKRRRAALGALILALVAIGIWVVRPPMSAGIYEGGGLLRASGSFLETLRAASSGWVDVGLGHEGPPDTLLWALLPGLLVTGDLATLIPLAYWLAVPVAGIGVWFAAGAGTRSVAIRAWAAVAWAIAPSFIPALHTGQLGPALAHVALPWLVLALVRAVGAERRDHVDSGMVGAKRVDREALHASRVSENHDGRPSGNDVLTQVDNAQADDAPTDKAPTDRAPTDKAPTDNAPAEVEASAAGETRVEPLPAAVTTQEVPTSAAPVVTKTNVAAAAGAAIAFALATAGAPVLLLPGIIFLWLAQLTIAHHRLAFLLIPLPALVLHTPRLIAMASEGLWQLAVSTSGLPQPGANGDPRAALIGFATALPTGELGVLPLAIAAWVGGGIVLVFALVALARRGGTSLAVRLGWFAVVLALASILAVRNIVVAYVGGEAITAATAPLVSLLLAGLFVAAIAGASGLNAQLAAHDFGWRHGLAALAGILALLVPLSWALIFGPSAASRMQVAVATEPPTPALAQQLASGAGQERTLLLTPAPDASLRADVVRTDGHTMLASASVIAVRALHEESDPAADALRGAVADLAAGGSERAARDLGRAGIGVIVVPPADKLDASVNQSAHATLLTALDATPGISRVTVNRSGTVYRIDTDAVTARARILDDGQERPLASSVTGLATDVPAGGAGRQLILAERADADWQARYDGVSLGTAGDDWRQAFDLPAHAGELHVRYRPDYQPYWAIGGILTAALTALLAIPRPRREVRP